MLSEARDRHVEDVLREDPERIRRGTRSRNDCPWPSPWESHLSAPSAAVEEHREYVTFLTDYRGTDWVGARNRAAVRTTLKCPGSAVPAWQCPGETTLGSSATSMVPALATSSEGADRCGLRSSWAIRKSSVRCRTCQPRTAPFGATTSPSTSV